MNRKVRARSSRVSGTNKGNMSNLKYIQSAKVGEHYLIPRQGFLYENF